MAPRVPWLCAWVDDLWTLNHEGCGGWRGSLGFHTQLRAQGGGGLAQGLGIGGGGVRVLLKRRGGGVLEPKSPKVCAPKIAQINISLCKFHFFPK